MSCLLQTYTLSIGNAGFITDTGKSPIVGLFFLNMWGDYQVVPFYPGHTMTFSSEENMEHVIKGDRNLRIQQQKPQSQSNCPQHYAIIVDETQIRAGLNLLIMYIVDMNKCSSTVI